LTSLEQIVNYLQSNEKVDLSNIDGSKLLKIKDFIKQNYELSSEQENDLESLVPHTLYFLAFCWFQAVATYNANNKWLYKPEFLKCTDFSKPDNQDKKIEESTDTYQSPPPVFEGEIFENQQKRSSSNNAINIGKLCINTGNGTQINEPVYGTLCIGGKYAE
jgi:hypothetical protein